jgi:hypothetical protein
VLQHRPFGPTVRFSSQSHGTFQHFAPLHMQNQCSLFFDVPNGRRRMAEMTDDEARTAERPYIPRHTTNPQHAISLL